MPKLTTASSDCLICIISKLKRSIWNLEDSIIDFSQCVLQGIMAIVLIYKKRMSNHCLNQQNNS